ncbi:MAG: RNA polymerase sigma factor WhiG [Actinobacteria bacterium]|nr:RNA polymerase sigma factor WhiG [Actinomycetota bacterium]
MWERFKETGDPGLREQLILNYAPLVKYVAGRVGVGLPNTIEHHDLVSYGMFGLMDALERFDLGHGVKFETYAITRIKGAIIDELRSVDWVPRSVRTKSKRIERAVARLEHQLQRTPTDEELADELEVSEDQLADMLQQVSLVSMVALDETFDIGDGDRVPLKDTIQDQLMPDPEATVDDAEMKRLLRDSITRLSEREQKVLALYYFEGLTLAQIGDILGVTESRICQIHTKSVMSLRAKLTERIQG